MSNMIHNSFMLSVGPSITNIFEQLIVWIDSDNFHSRTMVFMF